MAIRTCASLVLLLALALAPTAALAQFITPSVPLPGEEPTDSWANLSYAHQFNTDTDLDDVQFQRESALFRAGHRFGEKESKFKFAGQFTYQLSSYNFFNDDLGKLGAQGKLKRDLRNGPGTQVPPSYGGNLWQDVHEFTFLGMGTYELDEKWNLLGGGLFRLSGESGADFSEAMTGGAFGGFMYNSSETLQVGAVVGAMTTLEKGPAILPLPVVNWKFADAWRFKLGVQQLGAVGYGPEVIFTANEQFDVTLGASYQRRRYRLENNNSTKGFIGDETSVPVVVQFGWHPTPDIDLGVFAGMVMMGELKLEAESKSENSAGSKNGRRIFREDYDPTPTAGLKGTIRF